MNRFDQQAAAARTYLTVPVVTEAIAQLIDSELMDAMAEADETPEVVGEELARAGVTVISGSAADGAFEVLVGGQRFMVRVEAVR